MEPIIISLRPVLVFAVVLARVGGLVTFAPFWSHRAATAQVRAMLAFVLTIALAPVVAPRIPTPPSDVIPLALTLAGELLIGCALGFAGRIVFGALEHAAQIVGFQIGFSLASVIDPATRAQTAALGMLAQMLGLLALLAADGHHWLLVATVKSYHSVAPGGFHASPALAALLIRLSADALAVGVALAAPAIVTLLCVELALAVAGRAAPQLQVMVLSFPIKIAVGLWLLGASLYFMPGALRGAMGAMRPAVTHLLKTL